MMFLDMALPLRDSFAIASQSLLRRFMTYKGYPRVPKTRDGCYGLITRKNGIPKFPLGNRKPGVYFLAVY